MGSLSPEQLVVNAQGGSDTWDDVDKYRMHLFSFVLPAALSNMAFGEGSSGD